MTLEEETTTPKRIGYARYITEIDALKVQIEELQIELNKREKMIECSETQYQNSQAEVALLQSEVEELKRKPSTQELEQKVDALSNKLDTQTLVLNELTREFTLKENSLTQQLIDAQTTITHLTRERDLINSKKSEVELQLQNNVVLLDEKSKTNDELQVLVSRISDKLMLHETPGIVVINEERTLDTMEEPVLLPAPAPRTGGRRIPVSRSTRSVR